MFRYGLILAATTLLSACSGTGLGSGSNSGLTSGLGPAIKTECGANPAIVEGGLTLTGNVTYTSYNAITTGNTPLQLDYANPIIKAVRCAHVELIEMDSQGQQIVVNRVTTDLNGNYSITANANRTYNIHIRASLGTATDINTQIVDHTDGNKVYALGYGSFETKESNIALEDLTADSQWNLSRGHYYNGVVTNGENSPSHPAGPFVILDTILEAQRKVDDLNLQTTSSTSFPGLAVTWAATATTSDLNTSFYQGGQLHILGDQGNDTDEYDRHVVAHEWGHYLLDAFSRDDSLGGDHGSFDYLDPTVAFSEGFANAFSAYVTNDPIYKDTGGDNQNQLFVLNNLEFDAVRDNANNDKQTRNNSLNLTYEGLYSEDSVAEIILDILDNNNEAGDIVNLPFSTLFTQLKNSHKESPAFTSIIDFLFLLKNSSSSASKIQILANNENIGNIQEFGVSEHAFSDDSLGNDDLYDYYTQVPITGVPITKDSAGQTLEIKEDFGSLTTAGESKNKLLHRKFFVATPIETACFEISTEAIGFNDIGIETPFHFIDATRSSASINLNLTADKSVGFAVFANSPTEFSVKVERIADQCQ